MEGFGNEGAWRLGGTRVEADEGGGRGSLTSLGLFGRCGGGLRWNRKGRHGLPQEESDTGGETEGLPDHASGVN